MIDPPDVLPDMRRAQALGLLIAIGICGIVARLWYLQIAHGDELQEASILNQRRLIRRLPPRGIIQDRYGRMLAGNRERITVSVIPYEVRRDPSALPLLASLLGHSLQDLQDTVNEQYKLSAFDSVLVDDDVSLQTLTSLEEQKLNLPGVYIGPEPVRWYPDKEMCGHMLGQMGQIVDKELKTKRQEGYRPGDFCGKLGLERQYDDVLRGTNGGREIEVDARGRMRNEVSDIAPIPGATLTLNIDKAMEHIAYTELAAKQKPGAAVAMDPQTGAVYALVSYPSYDPNEFVRGISVEDLKRLNADPLKPQINRAVYSAQAPGSTFKLITATAGLETGKATADTTDFCGGSISLGRWVKHCDKRSGHGSLNLVEAVAQSCDIYFYHLGVRLGAETLAEYARKFGLGARSGIDLPLVDKAGHVPDPEKRPLGEGETMDFGIGQSTLACTPLQMCRAAAAIANGGTLYRPQLVKTITTYGANGSSTITHHFEPEVAGHLGVSAKTLDVIHRAMRAVMEPGGTGYATATVPGIEIAAKTGTAQRFHKQDNSWFVAYAPADHPRIAVCVFVDQGGWGATAAAPVARKMLASFFHAKLPEEQKPAKAD